MGIGSAVRQPSFEDAARFLGETLPVGSLYRLLAEAGLRLFPDGYFADLYAATNRGRPTVPARTVAVVMLLQAHEGLSDREACDRLAFDLRWKAAAGLAVTRVVASDRAGRGADPAARVGPAAPAVRRRRGGWPGSVGLLRGRLRVLDSTPLLDAVSTQDTVTQVRAAIRKLLTALTQAGAAELAGRRAGLRRDDDYASVGKPPCDWDDPAAQEQLVDDLVRDGLAALAGLDGEKLPGPVAEAAELLALVAGQDVEAGADGRFRIARRVAPDRLLSTVDPQARHGHKSLARRFDGYKAHVAVDPDDELITEVAVSPGNVPDRAMVDQLLGDPPADPRPADPPPADADDAGAAVPSDAAEVGPAAGSGEPLTVVGDSAYAAGDLLAELTEAGHQVLAKVPAARNKSGLFTKDRFHINLDEGTAVFLDVSASPFVSLSPVRPGTGFAATSSDEGGPGEPVLRRARTSRRSGRTRTHRRAQLGQAGARHCW